jgi:hypothetical protein
MTKAPLHFWIVAVLSLLWNGFGGYDYLMTQTASAQYLAKFTPEQKAYVAAMPLWMTCSWALGVWASVAGSLLLLLRRRWALQAFLVSLVGIAGMLVYSYVLTDSTKVMGSQGPVFSAVITVVGLFLAWYSRAMIRKGVLR